MANFTYFFAAGTTWTVPPNVTAIQVECFGSNSTIFSSGFVNSGSPPQGNYPGASYSKSSNIVVTPGATVYINVGANGGNTWFNTSNATPTSSSSPTSACLAVGTNTAAGSQVAANCGDVKYAGGNGRVTTGFTLTAQGGKAGPNGPGADVGDPYTNTATLLENGNSYLFCQGGGSNGGSQGSLGVPAYGRSGSGTAGMGGRYADGNVLSTTDTLGSSTYFNNLLLQKDSIYNNYGLLGGAATIIEYNCCGDEMWSVHGGNESNYLNSGSAYNGYIIITVTVASQKSIVFPSVSGGSFTIPNDFSSLVSIEAVGSGGTSAALVSSTNGGGGGGAAYAKTLGSSVTASMVAGSTVVYFGQSGKDSWLRIGTNSAPSSVTDGVLAKGGANGSTNVGGAGGSAASSIGDTKYSGGTGGAGYTSSRYNGGGGGGAGGPLGAGGAGGNAWNLNANRGGGGGGAANGGAAGSAPSSSTTGGNGGTITGGTGGAGATVAGTAGGRGTNGGGGGGSYGLLFSSYSVSVFSGLLNDSIYPLSGGQGGAVGLGGTLDFNASPGDGGASVYLNPSTYYITTADDSRTYKYGAGVIVFTYITTNNPNTALTGSTSSASGGALSPGQTLNQTLSSGSADALAGTLTNSQILTQALSSAIAEAFGGTFIPSNVQEASLSSVLALASSGTLTNSQLIIQALTGVSVNGQASSFPAFSEIVGAEAVAGIGVLGYVNTGWQLINTAGGSTSWIDVDTQQG